MNFIETPDTQQSPPPYFFPGMRLRNFLLRADQTRLQDYCNNFLNLWPDRYFKALAPLVYASVYTYPKMLIVGEEQKGFSSQNEYSFLFPVLRYESFGGFMLPRELTWVFPFIGVDNSTSSIAGQTVLGFPKLMGSISATDATDGSFSAKVAMPGFTHFSPTSAQQLLPIVGIQTGAPLVGGSAPPPSFPWSLFSANGLIDDLDDAVLELLELIDPNLFSVTILKQLRDPTQPTQALYQALLRADQQISNVSNMVSYGSAEIDIYDNATSQIVTRLGLAGGVKQGEGMRFAATASFGMTIDMLFDNITELG